MNKGIAILAAAALFASGLAIGALGAHMVYSQRIERPTAPPMPVGPMFERWLTHNLELSERQRDEVREILERSRREAEALRRDFGPRLRAMNTETMEAISEVLTPGQRARLQEFMSRQERRRERFRGEGPPSDRRRGPATRRTP